MAPLMESAFYHSCWSVLGNERGALWLSRPWQLSKLRSYFYGASKCLQIKQNGNDDLYLLRYLPECKCWVEKLCTELPRNIAKILGFDRCWICRWLYIALFMCVMHLAAPLHPAGWTPYIGSLFEGKHWFTLGLSNTRVGCNWNPGIHGWCAFSVCTER